MTATTEHVFCPADLGPASPFARTFGTRLTAPRVAERVPLPAVPVVE